MKNLEPSNSKGGSVPEWVNKVEKDISSWTLPYIFEKKMNLE